MRRGNFDLSILSDRDLSLGRARVRLCDAEAYVAVSPSVVRRTTNFEFPPALVARNLGCAALVQRPRTDVADERSGTVVRPIANPAPAPTTCLARPSNPHLL